MTASTGPASKPAAPNRNWGSRVLCADRRVSAPQALASLCRSISFNAAFFAAVKHAPVGAMDLVVAAFTILTLAAH
jgi:hypothetical protein